MITTDHLIFLELQKTASTHVAKILSDHFDGSEGKAKHGRLAEDTVAGSKAVFGGVRNPWAWYVSYWAYGCGKIGGIYNRQTNAFAPRPILRGSRPRVLKIGEKPSWPAKLRHLHREWRRNPASWERLYAIHEAEHRFSAFDDFGYSTLWPFAGLYTYLYEYLYLTDCAALYDGSITSAQQLAELDGRSNIVTEFIHMENLDAEFFDALARSGHEVPAALRDSIINMPKTNTSKRKTSWQSYYDDASARFVRERDGLIVRKHGYEFTPE